MFGDLFLFALREYSMICLGLYRYRDPQRLSNGAPTCKKRYVITFPPFNFVLANTDKVFVLKQFERPRKTNMHHAETNNWVPENSTSDTM